MQSKTKTRGSCCDVCALSLTRISLPDKDVIEFTRMREFLRIRVLIFSSEGCPPCALNILTTGPRLCPYNTHSLRGDKYGLIQPSDKNKNALWQCHTGRMGVCKGEVEGVHAGSVLSLSSAGFQPFVTNYHIQRLLFFCSAPLSTKCYTG